MKYTVVFEKAEHNYSAFVPDLPGCVATGKTRTEVTRRIGEAIELHLEGMMEDDEQIPEPKAWAALVEVGEQFRAHRARTYLKHAAT